MNLKKKKRVNMGARILIIAVVIIIVIGGYFLVIKNKTNVNEQSQSNTNQSSVSFQGSVVNTDCGYISTDDSNNMKSFATSSQYFTEYPEVKIKLDCIANNLINCIESKIIFGTGGGNGTLSLKKQDNFCVPKYEFSGRSIECDYTQEQFQKMYDDAGKKIEGGDSLIGYTLAFSMGISMLSNQENINVDFQGSKIPCRISGIQNTNPTQNNSPECTPNCAGKQCGSDGCGGSCGGCSSGKSCSNGECITIQCTPQCSGKQCGSDGCGGSCGNCLTGKICSNGQCIDTCVPKTCADLGYECGSQFDNCNRAISCGTCSYPNGPCRNGKCCVPNCAGIECAGDNGCGFACPYTCSSNQVCQNTKCILKTCSDSDGGINFNVKGTVTYSTDSGNQDRTDYCENNNILIEYYCTSNNNMGMQSNNCNCSSGACIQ